MRFPEQPLRRTQAAPAILVMAALLASLSACGTSVPEVQRLRHYGTLMDRPLAEWVAACQVLDIARGRH